MPLITWQWGSGILLHSGTQLWKDGASQEQGTGMEATTDHHCLSETQVTETWSPTPMKRQDCPGLEYRGDALPGISLEQSIISALVRLQEFQRLWLAHLFHEPRAQSYWDHPVCSYRWIHGL